MVVSPRTLSPDCGLGGVRVEIIGVNHRQMQTCPPCVCPEIDSAKPASAARDMAFGG
jgi:hypothetical protein